MERITKNALSVFKALSSRTRLEILRFLSEGEKSVSNIVERFNFSQPTISHHLKILSDVGLVMKKKYRQWAIYDINRPLWGYIQRIMRENPHNKS
jgi:DNA-binding transcriptional ArsR family regulator